MHYAINLKHSAESSFVIEIQVGPIFSLSLWCISSILPFSYFNALSPNYVTYKTQEHICKTSLDALKQETLPSHSASEGEVFLKVVSHAVQCPTVCWTLFSGESCWCTELRLYAINWQKKSIKGMLKGQIQTGKVRSTHLQFCGTLQDTDSDRFKVGGKDKKVFQSWSIIPRSWSLLSKPKQQFACIVQTKFKSLLGSQSPPKKAVSKNLIFNPRLSMKGSNLIKLRTSWSWKPG